MNNRALKKVSLPETATLHGIFAQARVEPETITFFKGWTRFTTDNHGEMQGEPLQGLFCAETRLMTAYEIRVNGEPISHRFSVQLSANEWTSTGAILNSGDSGNLPEGTLPKGSIETRILRKCDQGVSEQLFVKNNGIPKRKIHLELKIACPIHDSEFDEEMKRDKKLNVRGVRPKLSERSDDLLLHYERNFGRRKRTPTQELRAIYGSHTPKDGDPVIRGLDLSVSLRPGHPRAKIKILGGRQTRIQLRAQLGPREEICLQLGYEPLIDGVRMSAPNMDGLLPLPRAEADIPQDSLRFSSSHSTLNLLVGQAMSDLRTLRLPLFNNEEIENSNRYIGFIAGVPRYIGLFGRDTVISGWQSILFEPQFLEPALERVALYQGIQFDDWRDEEPDRMLHERRLNPQSEVGKMNRNLYFGDVTSTPFWILALSSLYRWTGERDLIKRHLQTIERCCHWIIRRLKKGDGFIYYAPASASLDDENRNQAWKDSGDAIVDNEGHIQVPPLALAEIQGYAYQALNEAAELLSVVDSKVDQELLRSEAKALKVRFNQCFWTEENTFYALALDERGCPLRSKASNIGHCLGTGIIESSRVNSVIAGLMNEDLFSGWGVRTLSSQNPAYDPFSYHRGSVWPVENAIIADGMALLGFHDQANQIMGGQLSLAALFQHMRLPEVFGGHSRCPEFPVPGMYNFANLLQTWSVSAISQFIQTILGIRPCADLGVLYLDPVLPDWISWMTLENLRVGSSCLKIHFWRESDTQSSMKTRWQVQKITGNIRVADVPEAQRPESKVA